jgi:hypothetical protein
MRVQDLHLESFLGIARVPLPAVQRTTHKSGCWVKGACVPSVGDNDWIRQLWFVSLHGGVYPIIHWLARFAKGGGREGGKCISTAQKSANCHWSPYRPASVSLPRVHGPAEAHTVLLRFGLPRLPIGFSLVIC